MRSVLILLPGNPSIPGIYDGFVESLREYTGCDAAVTLAHYGQGAASEPIEAERSLDRLVARHRDAILQVIEAQRAGRLYLLGHSLGAAVAVALYRELAVSVPAIRLVLICPFLGPMGPNRWFVRAMAVPVLNAAARRAVGRLLTSEALALPVLRSRLRLGSASEQVYEALRSGCFFDNFARLIADYQRFFDSRNLQRELRRLPPEHTLVVLAGDDFWVPPDAVAGLAEAAHCHHLADIAHGFCLHPQQSRAVARVSADFLCGSG